MEPRGNQASRSSTQDYKPRKVDRTMSGSDIITPVNRNGRASNGRLPTANPSGSNRGDKELSNDANNDEGPVDTSGSNVDYRSRNVNRDNKGIIAGDKSSNKLIIGVNPSANMLGNSTGVKISDATVTNISGRINTLSVDGVDNRMPNVVTNMASNENNYARGANSDTSKRQNSQGTGTRHHSIDEENFNPTDSDGDTLSDDATVCGSCNGSRNPSRGNTRDFLGNDNTNNSGIIAGDGSRNTMTRGPNVTSSMLEGARDVTFSGGSYTNIAGGTNHLHLVRPETANNK